MIVPVYSQRTLRRAVIRYTVAEGLDVDPGELGEPGRTAIEEVLRQPYVVGINQGDAGELDDLELQEVDPLQDEVAMLHAIMRLPRVLGMLIAWDDARDLPGGTA